MEPNQEGERAVEGGGKLIVNPFSSVCKCVITIPFFLSLVQCAVMLQVVCVCTTWCLASIFGDYFSLFNQYDACLFISSIMCVIGSVCVCIGACYGACVCWEACSSRLTNTRKKRRSWCRSTLMENGERRQREEEREALITIISFTEILMSWQMGSMVRKTLRRKGRKTRSHSTMTWRLCSVFPPNTVHVLEVVCICITVQSGRHADWGSMHTSGRTGLKSEFHALNLDRLKIFGMNRPL